MRRRKKKDTLFWGGCLLVVALIIAGLVVLVNLAAPKMEVAAACDGQGVAASAPYSDGPGPHRVEAVSGGRRNRYDCDEESWWAESVEETELVACVGSAERYVIETCKYTGGSDITRYGYKRQVTLVAARTGEVIATETFRGASPRSCQQMEERSIRKLEGSRNLNADAVCRWLGTYVVPDQEYGPESDGSGPSVEEPPPDAPTPIPALTQEPVPVASPEPTVQEPVEEVKPVPMLSPEPIVIEAEAPEEPAQAIVTPGSQPPEIAVLTGSPSLWSGPDHQGEHMGIFLKEGESVEILASTKEWAQVRWVSPDGEEVIGWVLSQFLGRP